MIPTQRYYTHLREYNEALDITTSVTNEGESDVSVTRGRELLFFVSLKKQNKTASATDSGDAKVGELKLESVNLITVLYKINVAPDLRDQSNTLTSCTDQTLMHA